jgi:hypothetical protein
MFEAYNAHDEDNLHYNRASSMHTVHFAYFWHNAPHFTQSTFYIPITSFNHVKT